MNDNYLQLRQYSAVKRFHIMRTLRTQTVGEHSHGVAMLVMQVMPGCSAELLKAALTHDLHERDTGDMPSTAKWLYPDLANAMHIAETRWNHEHGMDWNLTGKERAVLHYCDYLELLMWATEEMFMGNRYANEAVVKISDALEKLAPPTEQAGEIYTAAMDLARTPSSNYPRLI